MDRSGDGNGAGAGGRPLKIGVVSDSQGYGYREDWGFYNLERAFEVLADKGVDVLLNAGDVADYGDDAGAIAYYRRLFDEKFAARRPVHVACLGNHDYWHHGGGRTFGDCLRDFFTALGDPVSPLQHKVVGGIDFIALSSDNDHAYDASDCACLRLEIERAAARDPSSPIFVVTHYHPANSVGASYVPGCGKPALEAIFRDFPQVVSLSGHTHTPLEDERCIWQGRYTALNTSGLSYCCVREKFANACGPIPPYAREGVGFLYIELFGDHADVHRFNAAEKREIKPERLWRIDLPYSPERARYGDGRAAMRAAPEFPAGARLLFRYDYGFCYVSFDQARHDDFVHAYRVRMHELGAGGTVARTHEAMFSGNYYRLSRNREDRLMLRLPPNTLESGRTYRIEVSPLETFGREGRPISMTVSIPLHYPMRNMAEIGPQE